MLAKQRKIFSSIPCTEHAQGGSGEEKSLLTERNLRQNQTWEASTKCRLNTALSSTVDFLDECVMGGLFHNKATETRSGEIQQTQQLAEHAVTAMA